MKIWKEKLLINAPIEHVYKCISDFDLFEQVLAPGEALLLCSDGLSGMVPDPRMWALWHAASTPQMACEQLVEAANRAGGVDNITVVIVQAGSVGASH